MSFIRNLLRKNWPVFVSCWVLLFVLYLPAARAGWVQDITNLGEAYQQSSFIDYLNRSWSSVKSLYQFTQLVTWIGFRILGFNAWAWHLVHLTLHTSVVYLLYRLCRGVMADAGLHDAPLLSFAAALLYAVAPWQVEVVVWEPSFHFPQAALFILGILLLARRYLHRQKPGAALAAGGLFFLSVFSLEQFFLTPLFVAALALFYHFGLGYDRQVLRRLGFYFILPQIVMIGLHLVLFKIFYTEQVPHLGNQLSKNSLGAYAIKPPEYFFHLLWGRFLPGETRLAVKDFFRNYWVAGCFYLCLAVLGTYLLLTFRRMQSSGKVATLFFIWMMIALSILLPLYFPDILLGASDRYMYLLSAFYFMMVVTLAARIRQTWVKALLWTACFGINTGLSLQLIRYWRLSDRIIATLQHEVPLQPGKTVILLNSPGSYKGIYMIGCTFQGEFKLMHDLFYPPPLPARMTDVMGYNMAEPDDGARVRVLNDTAVRVTLRYHDPHWWFTDFDLTKLDNELYRVTNFDTGRAFDLILKGDPVQYQLLYQVGARLKTVDMRQKGAVQE